MHRESDHTYGAIPPYEVAVIHTLRAEQPAPGFVCVGYWEGYALYEWRKRPEPIPSFIPVEAAHALRVVEWPRL